MADENVDVLRAQNATLRIQCHSNESEILRLKHALDIAMTKAGSWAGMKQRVTVNKPISEWTGRDSTNAIAAAAGGTPTSVMSASSSPAASVPGGIAVPFAASTIAASLERQLRESVEQLQASQQHAASLQEALNSALAAKANLEQSLAAAEAQQSGGGGGPRGLPSGGDQYGVATSHLLGQLQFLHAELERLENELADVRRDCAQQLRAANVEHATALAEAEARLRMAADEKARLLARLGPAGRQLSRMENGEDFLARCKMLEGQLAAALAEKNAFSIEKHELMTKVRKLEAAAREKKLSLSELQKQALEESASNEETGRTLRSIVDSLSTERAVLQEQVMAMRKALNSAPPRFDSYAQCEETRCYDVAMQCDPPASVRDDGCQVDTIRYYSGMTSSEIGGSGTSMQSVTHMLETKCSEVESLRQQLDDLAAVHREALNLLEASKQRLVEESSRRKELAEDCERLGLQVRSLQQRTSQQSSSEREKDIRLAESEAKTKDALGARLKVESELQQLKETLAMHHSDMQNVVQSQNYANHQINALASENEALRGEIQKLLHREAQCNFSLRAKDVELGEILAAYQQCVREAESHVQARNILEREVENVRAAASAKEERIINMQEQISHLHAREQQLSLDLQSFDYEGSQLQRKLVQSESHVAQLSGQVRDISMSLHTNERVTEELERNLAELSKQLVLKDNECLILRQRADIAEREWNTMNISRQSEMHRLRDLEDANARLVVKGILTHKQQEQQQEQQEGLAEMQAREEKHQKTLSATTMALAEANAALKSTQQQVGMQADQMRGLEVALREEQLAKERLQRIVLDQAAILSQFSK